MNDQLDLFDQPENEVSDEIKEPKLIHADCLDAMRAMEADSIDAIVTDPPYGLVQNKRGGSGVASVDLSTPYGRARIGTGNGPGGFMGKEWDSCVPGVPFWTEALRVAKPGAHLVAFGGTRTFHRLACAIEDAGWEVRDCLSWLYGSGFPKSLDVSKAIDKAAGAEREVVGTRQLTGYGKANVTNGQQQRFYNRVPADKRHPPPPTPPRQWEGWGTALKPAWEPIILARKPLVGTVAANVLAHGTGAINVDACRIGDFQNVTPSGVDRRNAKLHELGYRPGEYPNGAESKTPGTPPGRWPANVALDEEAAAMLDEQTGTLTSGKAVIGGHRRRSSTGAATGFALSGNADGSLRQNEDAGTLYGDSGGASRFFYTAKASRRERGEGNTHPCVKPIALMKWLIRMVTPKGGTVLDPFAGSGTTLLAARAEGFDCIGIEREAEYVEIVRKRLEEK